MHSTAVFEPRRQLVLWLLAWAVCVAAVLAVWARPASPVVDEDELYWIGSAYYYELAFRRGEWGHPDWKLLPARENPPVAKYAIGLGLAAAGQRIDTIDLLAFFFFRFESIPGAWGNGSDHAKRAAIVARMDPRLRQQLRDGATVKLPATILQAARIVMIVGAALASGIVFLLGRATVGAAAGLIASQLVLLHPVVVYAYNHAMADAVALLFATAAAAFVWRVRNVFATDQRVSPARAGGVALIGGGLLALACGAKMNSLVVVALAAISLAGVAWQSARQGRTRQAATTIATGVGIFLAGLVVFTGFNPAITQDFLGGLGACVAEHRLTDAIQAAFLPGHLETLAAKLMATASCTTFTPVLAGLLGAMAAWRLVAGRPGERFVAGWWLLAFALVAAWIPFSWPRYVMPLIVPTALLTGSLAVDVFRAVIRRMRDRGPAGARP